MPKKRLDFQKEEFTSQAHSGSHCGLSNWNQAKPSNSTVIPISQGRKGSTQENVELTRPMPAIKAATGVIQHSEATKAVNNPAPIHFGSELFEFLFFMRLILLKDYCF
jgi:hypothetical protein